MLNDFLGAALVSLLNFGIHAVVTALIVVATHHTRRATSEAGLFVRLTSLMMVTLVALMAAHLAEIAVWSVYYGLAGIDVSKVTAFEFAFENYTALGYGDAIALGGRRLIGPITALNGLLLIGWSVAVIFEVMRMAELKFERRPRRRR